MKLNTFKITIRPFEWDFWPHWTGGNTPNIREIFFLCFRINIYLEARKTKAQKEGELSHYKELYGLDD